MLHYRMDIVAWIGVYRLTLARYSNMTAVGTLLKNIPGLNGAFMDAPSSDPRGAEAISKQAYRAASSTRTIEYCVAATIVVLAVAVSPFTIRLLTGRPALNFRPLLLSATFDVFLLLVAGALLARGPLRQIFFYLIAWAVPVALLAGLETIAGAIHLSDHVSIIQDLSTIKRGSNWGPGIIHLAPEKDGFFVYRPWSGNGVTINALGLRTPPPTPKSPGERRIAISGGSNVWGFRLADADTLPALLQAVLRRNGYDKISVYNFGIEDANMARELALLEHFKDIYGIDQVVFFSGGADVLGEYFAIKGQPLEASPERITNFELYRTLDRIRATWFSPSSDRQARIDQSLSRVAKRNRLTDGIMAANAYCRAAALHCDFVLMPLLVTRQSPIGTEAKLKQTFGGLYPRLDVLARQMYRSALDLRLTMQVHDFTAVFDSNPEQVYLDGGHNNEAGHLAIVDALLPIVMPTPPSK
jgi:lysophospholipase L1-like esterase